MSKIALNTDSSGTGIFSIASPNSNNDRTLTLPDSTGTIALTSNIPSSYITSGTAVTASGTSIDFTGIPSTVKRVTVMFSGVSTNGTSNILLQLGTSGGVQATGYAGASGYVGGTPVATNPTIGFSVFHDTSSDLFHGSITFSQLNSSSNIWVGQGIFSMSTRAYSLLTSGSVTLSGTLDRVRITTASGTPTFDAGTINILYE